MLQISSPGRAGVFAGAVAYRVYWRDARDELTVLDKLADPVLDPVDHHALQAKVQRGLRELK